MRVILLVFLLSFNINVLAARGGAYDSRPLKEQGAARFNEKVRRDFVKISAGSDVKVTHDQEQKKIIIGRNDHRTVSDHGGSSDMCNFLYGNEGKIFKHRFSVQILDGVYGMQMKQFDYKDQAIIRVAEKVVFTSTGADYLSFTSDRFGSEKDIIDEAFDSYRGIKDHEKVVSINTDRVATASLYVDLMPFLKNKTVDVEIEVAVGYEGGYQLVIDYSTSSKFHDDPKKNVYPCKDSPKKCTQGKEQRIVEGVYVTRDCWQWSYAKRCEYPSKDDCSKLENNSNCYFIQDKECILYDGEGNCVNRLKEYSCTSEDDTYEIRRPKYISTKEDSNIPGGVKCTGLPCFEGYCHQPKWDKDTDMVESTSKLKIGQHAQGKDLTKVSLFPGTEHDCGVYIAACKNCCKYRKMNRASRKNLGWSHHLGVKCSQSEIELADKRDKNLCVYVGEKKETFIGLGVGKRCKYCCFGSMLHKIIQVQGRQQIGRGWGSYSSPDCGGLNIQELSKIDFNKIDFSEAFPELLQEDKLEEERELFKEKDNEKIKRKIPSDSVNDVKSRITKSFPSKSYDGRDLHGDLPSQINRKKYNANHGTTGKINEHNYGD